MKVVIAGTRAAAERFCRDQGWNPRGPGVLILYADGRDGDRLRGCRGLDVHALSDISPRLRELLASRGWRPDA